MTRMKAVKALSGTCIAAALWMFDIQEVKFKNGRTSDNNARSGTERTNHTSGNGAAF
ncbi:hypothetical protein CBFG_05267 [Clostridiales bacterium 1_7_47FAA]|nr:hypothetical protein CBFG_05267 [Clostridiales bacterium 1_7_47FAA]